VTETGIVHIDAQADVVAHDTDSLGCTCGPTVRPFRRDDGTLGWHVIHYHLAAPELPGRNAHA
jgi:hypothetical protein